MSVGPFQFNRQPKQPVTLKQKRNTYRRLWLICEIYRPEWKAALERARRRVGVMKSPGGIAKGL